MRFLFLLLAGLLAACSKPVQPAPSLMPAAPGTTAPAIPFLALGDSYTIGEGVPEADRWPVQLAELTKAHAPLLAAPDIIAQTGWTTAELQAAIAASGNHRTDYGLVSLLIGVNNQYRHQPLTQYRTEFGQLLATATAFAGGRPGRVVVLSIPDWGQSPYASPDARVRIGQEIDQFNAVARQECQQAGIAFVDITPLTRAIAGDPSQFTADGLHYTGSQMQRWVATTLPVVQQLLK